MNTEEIIQKYQLDKKTWTRKGFHGILHFFFPVGEEPIKPLKEYYSDSHKITVFYFSGTYGDWFWNNEDMLRLRKSFIQKVNKNPKVLTKLVQDWHQRLRILDKIMQNINNTNLSKLPDAELLELYNKWYKAYLSEYGISIGIQDSFSMHAEEFLRPHFQLIIEENGLGDKFEEYYLLLTSPVEESFFTKEYRDRLNILKKLKYGKNIKKDLQNHAKRYHWLQNNYAKDICLGMDFFQKQLNEIKSLNAAQELKNLDLRQQEIIKNKKALVEKLKLDQESKNLIKITEVFAYMQDERKKYVLLATHYQNLFLKELEKRLKLSRELIEFTYIHELKDLFNKINKKELEERRKHVLVINNLQGYEVLSGNLAKEVYEKIFSSQQKELNEFKGTVASPGKVIGRVKIVLRIHDLINVREKDIIVASMTRPEMMVALEKASGIITDEGGITCHAAVISREMGIPCIIGTKVATKVLKDGDEIELDAEKGLVKIIKKVSR